MTPKDKKTGLWPEWATGEYFKSLPVSDELAELLKQANKKLEEIPWKE